MNTQEQPWQRGHLINSDGSTITKDGLTRFRTFHRELRDAVEETDNAMIRMMGAQSAHRIPPFWPNWPYGNRH